jgi:hypothetical protein
MMPLQINKEIGRNIFPKYYLEVFNCCGLSKQKIARRCNIGMMRLEDLMYGKNAVMDPKEFKAIKTLVKEIEQEKINNGECVQNWPLPPNSKEEANI